MTTQTLTASAPAPRAQGGTPEPAYAVFSSLAAAEPDWRALEARGLLTPYQRFDWISDCLAAGFEKDARVRIIVLSHADAPIAILPLALRRRMGLVEARLVGAGMSNSDMPILDPEHAAQLTPDVIRRALQALGEAGDPVDLAAFVNQPQSWAGTENPLMGLPRFPGPNNFYRIALPPADGGSYIESSFPHKRRTNIKRSMRRLTEGWGAVALRHATTPEEVERFHAVFLDQRARRFRQMGIENIFAQPQFQTFFKTAGVHGLSQDEPVLRLHALFAGEEIVATCLGTYANGHYSQYINSTSDGPAAKYTLMGVMMALLVDELRCAGITSMDMGLGDFDYKSDWTYAETVYDSLVPVSARGRAAIPALGAARGLKRRIKQTPALWRLARAVLALKTRLAERTGPAR